MIRALSIGVAVVAVGCGGGSDDFTYRVSVTWDEGALGAAKVNGVETHSPFSSSETFAVTPSFVDPSLKFNFAFEELGDPPPSITIGPFCGFADGFEEAEDGELTLENDTWTISYNSGGGTPFLSRDGEHTCNGEHQGHDDT